MEVEFISKAITITTSTNYILQIEKVEHKKCCLCGNLYVKNIIKRMEEAIMAFMTLFKTHLYKFLQWFDHGDLLVLDDLTRR